MIYLIPVFFLIQTSPANSQEILDQYLEIAAEQNSEVKARFNDFMAALEKGPQAGGLPDPQFAFGYFIKPIETRVGPQQAKFSLTQMFPWFGTLGAKEEVYIQVAKAKYEMFEETKSKLYKDVKSAYFNLYFTRKATMITSENIGILNSFQKMALIKIEAGKASSVDELRIEMEIADLENQLALLQDKYIVQSVMFNNLLNVDRDQIINLPETLWEYSLNLEKDTILTKIAEKNHQLLSLELQSESLRYKEEVARKSGLPNLAIGIDYIMVGKGSNDMAGTDAIMFPKIGLTVPLYRSKYKAMINEAVYLQLAKDEEKLNKENILESVFENVYKDYRDANRRLSLFRKQTVLAQKSITILEVEYANDGRNFEEVLRMERKVLKYELELEKARTDKQAAIAIINYLMGN